MNLDLAGMDVRIKNALEAEIARVFAEAGIDHRVARPTVEVTVACDYYLPGLSYRVQFSTTLRLGHRKSKKYSVAHEVEDRDQLVDVRRHVAKTILSQLTDVLGEQLVQVLADSPNAYHPRREYTYDKQSDNYFY